MIKGRFERDLPDLEERGRILILSISKIRNEFRPPLLIMLYKRKRKESGRK